MVDEGSELTGPERRLRGALRILAAIFAAAGVVCLALVIPGQADAVEAVLVVHSLARLAVLAGLAAIAAADVRRFAALIVVLVAAQVLSAVSSVVLMLVADTSPPFDLFGPEVSTLAVLIAGAVADLAVAGALVALYLPARRARYGTRYLWASQFETLTALAEVVIPDDDRRVPPAEVARAVDGYMADLRARRKWVVQAALTGLLLYPLLFGLGPLPTIEPGERLRFIRRRFVRDVSARRVLLGRGLVRAMIRLGQQLVFLGYYSDHRTFEVTGYVPFSERSGAPVPPEPAERRLVTVPPEELADTVEADVVVIGSGAAGATLAYCLAECGRSVMVLEAGRHVDPSQFVEDEIPQISRLYADGALQLTRDFSFQVLQGRCVGGTTVVNNAVCFDMPDDVLDRWNGPEFDTGLDPGRLAESFLATRRLMRVARQPGDILNRGAGKFTEGVARLGLDRPPYEFDVVEANIAGCLGSGYCNIGCPFGAKLSMLDTVLPDGQRLFGDRLQIVPECTVERITHGGGVADGVVAALADGRRIRFRPRTVVVAAGTIASSWLLWESRIRRSRVGRGVSFNMGSPVVADFEDELRAYEGLQISHYLRPPEGQGFVLETWFNPVVSQALNMPGWFEEHAHNMRRFRHLMAAGALVGTEATGRVKPALTGGPDLVYTPARADLERLVEGLKLTCQIFLRAGATRVMPNTYDTLEITSEEQLDRLDRYVRDATDLAVGTGHPQGGNPISRDPSRGVVDERFRVHGMQNVYVCDASVFPTSITVNPQLTVMALADYAAPAIATH
jgi:choline dehydrogenase-like flavoprotein